MTTPKKQSKVTVSNTQVKELEAKVAELTAGWQRTQADFVNFRKRAEGDRSRIAKNAKIDLVLSILPVLDNFRLSTQHLPEDLKTNNWAQGIQHIERQLEQILLDEGISRITAVGQQFDPNLHEAVESIPSDCPEGQVIEETLVGYRLDDTVIRPSKVKVACSVESLPKSI
jgi:molecular chaperone GrpE